MNAGANPTDGNSVTVHVPLAIRKRGGRKLILAADGTTCIAARPRIDSTLVKSIARAHRWQRLLEEGAYCSMRDLAAAEKISPSYISKLLRLTLLSPDVTEAALDGSIAADTISIDIGLSPVWHKQQPEL